MVVSTSLAQSNDDFIMGIALSLRVVVGLGGRAFMVVECERSADCDVMATSLMSSRAFATSSTPSFLTHSSSSSLFSSSLPFPIISFSISSLSSLCFFSFSSSMVPSKSASSYLVAVHAQLACFASQASRRDLTAANVMRMWSGNIPGLSRHH